MLNSLLLIKWGNTIYIFFKMRECFIKTLLLAVQEANRACRQLVIKYPGNSFMPVPRSLVSKTDFKILEDRILPTSPSFLPQVE